MTPTPFLAPPLVPHRAHHPIVPKTLILPRVSLEQEEVSVLSPNVIEGMFHNLTVPTLAVDDKANAKDVQPGQPLVLQRWEPGMILRKHKHTQVPIWIKLRHLPVEFWTSKGLSTVASRVGRPLYPDAITRACTRLDIARVCVMLDISSKLPKHILMADDGSEVPCKVDVKYEWVPPKCKQCLSLGHTAFACLVKKQTVKPPVSVFCSKEEQQARSQCLLKRMFNRPHK
ncbi:UNVERIFIED_CONTAM: hypothetical protein Sradi_3179200 [Sesamum radiatum]|uniref:DUF4283 domain-containing protein n=1 Tax=Sesamum radiatum TaxID=300843 RepID=A0AAW2REY9_SESRA